MKKRNLAKKLIAILGILAFWGMNSCTVKPKSYCQNSCPKKQKEKKLYPIDKNSFDIFPSKDFIIKI